MQFSSRGLKCYLFLILSCCNCALATWNIFSPTLSSLIVAVTMQQVPSATAFPFDFLFKKQMNPRTDRLPPNPTPTKSPRYYEFATKLLEWAFNELEESEEQKPNPSSPRFDIDKMASSSEEEDEEIQNPTKMTREIPDLKKRRVGAATKRGKAGGKEKAGARKRKTSKPAKRPASTSAEDDDSIEKASVQELKNMLKQMKREEEAIFGVNIFTNRVTRAVFSFGTNIFKTMYCGWSPRNSYCISDTQSGPASIFDGVTL